ncbi:hypothetical protein B0H14DRAFT_3867811 [Mycena olivaceomarginata]|nr:hypothetical protein B0H14DRAFT_3867811 [Mycena olivaceomarginata]
MPSLVSALPSLDPTSFPTLVSTSNAVSYSSFAFATPPTQPSRLVSPRPSASHSLFYGSVGLVLLIVRRQPTPPLLALHAE